MEAIRTKDKLFLAVVVPAALVAAYAFLWRADAVRRVAALKGEEASLVTVEDYPLDRQAAERRLAKARAELEMEKKIPAPALKVKANPGDTFAARERAVLSVLRLAGLAVERIGSVEGADAAARDVLARTGLRENPVCRRYAIAGRYPQVCAALRSFADREMAVIPSGIEMTAPGRWTLVLWL